MEEAAIIPAHVRSPLVIRRIALDGQTVRLEGETIATAACCPTCGTISAKVHDRYTRSPMDLPWRGHTAHLVVTVRRFRCVNPACSRTTFAED